jgi:hypothetical protein
MAESGSIRTVSPDEFDEVFVRITAEGITGLAFAGGVFGSLIDSAAVQLREKSCDSHVYVLRQNDESLATRIAQLSQLKWLSLMGVELDDGGARVIAKQLGQLTSLDVSMNNIGDAGARAIAENLGQLNSLSVGSNNIGDDGAQAIAKHLGQLASLCIESSPIAKAFGGKKNWLCNSAVAAIAAGLPQLSNLDVSGNEQINDIAPLSRLLGLRRLNISHTSVTDLSPFSEQILAGLPVQWKLGGSEDGIFVAGCPLVHPTVEIALQGPEAVRNYFREIAEQGVDRLYEAKVLILGEGEAGKTSLLRRLYFPDQPLPTVDETTRGIDVHRQDFPIDGDRNFRLNVWDFGGQQIYHATHQFFLTKNSLYILVDDTKKDDRSIHDEGFNFWLEVVETLSGSSPLLIFQNEKGAAARRSTRLASRAASPMSWRRIAATWTCPARPTRFAKRSSTSCNSFHTSARRCRPNGFPSARRWKRKHSSDRSFRKKNTFLYTGGIWNWTARRPCT